MTETRNHTPLLFLSHAGADTDAARTLKRRIETTPAAREQGLKVWFDKDDLRPGLDWQRQLEDAIERHATAFAVYLGSRGIVNWVEREVHLALERATRDSGRFPFIPIISAAADASEVLPGFARQFQGVNDVETRPDEFQKLVAAALGAAGVGELALEAEPFFGLRAIDESRSHLFFGRAQETQELVERLCSTRLFMITGDSGSGKSSLVRAGLIPRWRGGAVAELAGRRPDDEIWHVIDLRPGRTPRRALGDAVFQAAATLGASAADRGTYKSWAMDGAVEQVRDGLRCGLSADRTRTLIVVDQFEELLTQAPKEQVAPFIALLLDLADPEDDAFAVVLTMRRDYYNLCSACPELYARLEQGNRGARYLLGRMSDDGLRAIVTEPLKLAGIDVDDRRALADSVLRDVGNRPGDLALIQFALTETWRRRKEYGGDLLRAYAGVGRVEGALAVAAERVYEQVLGGDAHQTEAEAIFIRLVRLGDTGGATRRQARRLEFSDTQWRQLQKLASEDGNRLVLMAGEDGAETAEVAHEALVTQWPRYQRWLQAAAEDKRTLDTLIGRAAVWATADDSRRPEHLATGAERDAFARLAQAHAAWLSEEEHAFVTASNAAHAAQLRQEQEAREREHAARLEAEARPRAARALAFGIGLGVIFSVLAISPIGAAVEEAVLPWLFRMRGAIEPPSDVIIVAIDKRSADHFQLPPHPREWPRSHHARLIRELKARGAAAIIFDLKFERPRSPAEDDEFASAMRDFGRVFLLKERDRQDEAGVGSIGSPIIDVPLQRKLEEAALGVAPFPLPIVESRWVSQVWAFHDGDATLPAVALHVGVEDRWLALLSTSGFPIDAAALDAKKVSVSSDLMHSVRLAFQNNSAFAQTLRRQFEQDFQVARNNGLIGTSASLEAIIRLYEGPDSFYLNFYGPPGRVPTISYYHVFSGDGDADSIDFRGKSVFVGLSELTKPVQEDTYPTAFGRDDGVDLSGVEIAATAFANMLKDQALQPAGPGLSASIVFAVGVVITLCSLTMPAGFALVIAVAMAAGYAVGAQTVFNHGALWLPVATPLLLQIPTSVVLGFASQNAFGRRQRRRIQRALGH